jgi:ribonuclease HI
LQVTGSKIFTDADWKTKKAPGISSGKLTGIGVYCQNQEGSSMVTVMVQASIPTAQSALQAEADALLFAARLAVALNIQQHTFLTDSTILANAVAEMTVELNQILWKI